MNEKKRKEQEDLEEEHNPSKKLGTEDQLGWTGLDLFGVNNTPPHSLRRTPNSTPTSTPPHSPSHSNHESENEKYTRKKLNFDENGTIEVMTECIIASATRALSPSLSSSSPVPIHLHLSPPVLSSDETLEESEQDEEGQNQNQNQDQNQTETDTEAILSAETDMYQLIKRLRYVAGQIPRPVLSQPLPLRDPNRATLVLDLDETLVHSSVEPLDNPDYSFAVQYNGHDYMVHARVRPNLLKFLHRVAELYEIVIFTASQRSYADKLLDILDPENKFFHHRLFREACTCVEGNYLKDLEILGRELSRVIIIDNSLQSFAFQLDNGIPITTWLEDKNDSGLVELLPLLEELSLLPDVRPSLRARYRLHEKIE